MKILVETDNGEKFQAELRVPPEVYAVLGKNGIPEVVERVIDWAKTCVENMTRDVLYRTARIEKV